MLIEALVLPGGPSQSNTHEHGCKQGHHAVKNAACNVGTAADCGIPMLIEALVLPGGPSKSKTHEYGCNQGHHAAKTGACKVLR